MTSWRRISDGFFTYVTTRRKAGLFSPTRFLGVVDGVVQIVVYDTSIMTRKAWKLGSNRGPACERPTHWRVLPATPEDDGGADAS